jgi:hypothetical protein
MALQFNMRGKRDDTRQMLSDQMAYANIGQSFSDIGHDLGTAVGYGVQQYRQKRGGEGPLAKAWRNYKGETRKEGVPTLSFEKWKEDDLGKAAKDKLKQGKKWGAALHEDFLAENPLKDAYKEEDILAKMTALKGTRNFGTLDDKRLRELAIKELKKAGKEPEKQVHKAGAFTNWLKSDEGKRYKKTWRGEQKELRVGKRFEDKSWEPEARAAYRESLAQGGTPSLGTNVGFRKWLRSSDGVDFR